MYGAIITAIITLIVTIVAGILLDYIKTFGSRLAYNISSGIPIEIDNKKICVYVVTLQNPSSKTINDIMLSITHPAAGLKNGGIEITNGLKYVFEEKENCMEINIPYLKKNDQISVTVYEESIDAILSEPEVVIRSPQKFKLSRASKSLTKKLMNLKEFIPGVVSAGIVFSVLYFTILGEPGQRDILIFLANSNDLPELSLMYANGQNFDYYDQGDIVYAKAKTSRNYQEMKKYRSFLEDLENYSRLSKTTKTDINYNISKISMLLNDDRSVLDYYNKAALMDRSKVEKMLTFDEDYKEYLVKKGIIKI